MTAGVNMDNLTNYLIFNLQVYTGTTNIRRSSEKIMKAKPQLRATGEVQGSYILWNNQGSLKKSMQ